MNSNFILRYLPAGFLCSALALILLSGCSEKDQDTKYVMYEIKKGSIENVVSSSGTLEPVGTVDVISQMNGTVEKIYSDFNDRVEKGDKLIDMNTDILKIQVCSAEADVVDAEASYEHTLLEYNNNQKLFEKKLLSEFDLHASKTDLASARAALIRAQAQLDELRMELDQYALILSPISGVVLERNVEEGDTVQSGSSATSLFSLARDLSQMEIHATVDELDISSIKTGQTVRFSVDAYPEDQFDGSVRQVRLVPSTDDNLVSYTVIIDASNPELKLLPGMTAAVDFLVEQKDDVLIVPNAALRFTPPQMKEPDSQEEGAGGGVLAAIGGGGGRMGGGPGGFPGGGPPPGEGRPGESGERQAPGGQPMDNHKTLWTLDENRQFRPLMVIAGISDGIYTEVTVAERPEGAGKGAGPEGRNMEGENPEASLEGISLEGMSIIEKIQVN